MKICREHEPELTGMGTTFSTKIHRGHELQLTGKGTSFLDENLSNSTEICRCHKLAHRKFARGVTSLLDENLPFEDNNLTKLPGVGGCSCLQAGRGCGC
jgi:hypothetical protein